MCYLFREKCLRSCKVATNFFLNTEHIFSRSKRGQILNLGRSHWNTVSTIGCKPAQVKVYDSLHMNLTSSEKKLGLNYSRQNQGRSPLNIWMCSFSRGVLTVGYFPLLLLQLYAMDRIQCISSNHRSPCATIY